MRWMMVTGSRGVVGFSYYPSLIEVVRRKDVHLYGAWIGGFPLYSLVERGSQREIGILVPIHLAEKVKAAF